MNENNEENDPRIQDLKRVKKELEEMDRSTTQDLSGDASKQEPIDMERMRKIWPHYPYPESKDSCPFCNKFLKENKFHEQLGFRLIFKNKETGELSSLLGPTIEGCEQCGRKLSITKEKGIEFLD